MELNLHVYKSPKETIYFSDEKAAVVSMPKEH